jgi:hypothetical protein
MMAKKKKQSRVPGMRVGALGEPGGAFEFFGPSPERDFAIEQGMPEAAFGSLMMIGAADNPANPACPGPIVIHEDGSIECEAGCEGIRFAYHGPGATVSCRAYGPSASHNCSGCSTAAPAA